MRDCTTPGCTDPYLPFFYSSFNTGPKPQDGGTLPAGDYHLYLVADAAPTTVTLRLHGLSSRRTVLLPATKAVSIAVPKPDLAVAPPSGGPLVYANGLTHEVTHWGALDIVNFWYLLPLPNEETLIGDCHFYNSPPTPVLSYNSPLCQGFMYLTNLAQPVGPHSGPLGVVGQYGGAWIAGAIQAPGTWSDGGRVDVVGPVTSVDLHELVVGF